MPNDYESVESILALEKEVVDFPINNEKKGFVWLSDDLLENFDIDLSSLDSRTPVVEYIDLRLLSGQISRAQLKGKYYGYDSGNKLFYLNPLGRDLNKYRCTFRAAEFYLIASEAANELDNSTDAKQYLKDLMIKRFNSESYERKATLIDAMDKDALRTEILNERRREFALQGHTWFDLRRTTQPKIEKVYTENGEVQTYTLEANDDRYTLRLPSEAVAANPELEIWSY